MSPITSISLSPGAGSAEAGVDKARDFAACCLLTSAILCASLATAASLGIAALGGWQRGGLPVERVMNVTLSWVAVLLVHLLPIGWRLLGVIARICTFALWWIGIAVILYGQITFLLVSQQHAGSVRATSITATAVPPSPTASGRTRTEIAQDVAKVTTDLARADARRCEGDCPTLIVRRKTLAARLSALSIESDEAARREAEDDRRIEHSDRNEALRASLRADPVASVVASWVHTTESRLELTLAVACAVVLEGTAIVGWQLVSVASSRVSGLEMIALGPDAPVPERKMVASRLDVTVGDDEASAGDREVVALAQSDVAVKVAGGRVMLADDFLLEQIREAVIAKKLMPTQTAIRKFLRCGQPKAGYLNRLYLARFGAAGRQGDKHAIQ